MIRLAQKIALWGMGPMSSIKLSSEDQQTCLQVAKQSIEHGLQQGSALLVTTIDYSPNLQQQLATFVTLHKQGELRGCIGALEAYQPLINDVAEHAYAAAFRDPRFSAVSENEYKQLEVEISVLGKPVVIDFTDEDDLLNQLRPGIDGLILEYGSNRGTFLPTVWEQLPDKIDFFNHLKNKAGLPMDWWQDDVEVSRYETFSFS